MRRIVTILMAVLLVGLLSGCKLKKAIDEAGAIKDSLDQVGTTELMEKTADDTYDPPADNRLTEAQIQMYLKVREQEKKIAQVAKAELEKKAKESEASGGDKSLAGMVKGFEALGSVADYMTADIRAAHELGYNTAEYQWVKERVLEASGSVFQEQMASSMTQMMDKAYTDMKQQYDAATDEQSKKAIGEMLAQYEQNKKEMAAQQPDVDPAVAYNRQLLSKHENALNAIAVELAKWTGNDAEAQKAVQEWDAATKGEGK